MKIESRRFGAMDVSEDQLLTFGEGVIGFPEDRQYVLIPHGTDGFSGWLQSTTREDFALPVISAHAFGIRYPDVQFEPIGSAASVEGDSDDVAVMVVLSAPQGQPATVNLMAPILVNVATHEGAQVILRGSRFTTRELFVREVATETAKGYVAAE